jgi:outer membrane lipoprotein SlyB
MRACNHTNTLRKHIMKTLIAAALIVLSSVASAQGCGWGTCSNANNDKNPNAQVYNRGESMSASKVEVGYVMAVNEVEVAASSTATTTGGTIGGVIGAAVLNRQGKDKSATTQAALTALGGLLGAVAGNTVAGKAMSERAFEIVVYTENKQMISVTQAGQPPAEGDIVGIQYGNGGTRLIKLPNPKNLAATEAANEQKP